MCFYNNKFQDRSGIKPRDTQHSFVEYALAYRIGYMGPTKHYLLMKFERCHLGAITVKQTFLKSHVDLSD